MCASGREPTTFEMAQMVMELEARAVELPPGPLQDTSAKLVNDENHPWKPLEPGDMRGPCPGLNTLASHGVSGDIGHLMWLGMDLYLSLVSA